MHIGPKLIAIVFLIVVLAAACSGGVSNESDSGPAEVAGPALVMFYTDN
jgi:hypothetical protein